MSERCEDCAPEFTECWNDGSKCRKRPNSFAAPAGSPLPWKLHRTGSTLGIKAADSRFVISKVVSQMSMADYARLLEDFNTILKAVNDQAEARLPDSAALATKKGIE